MMPNVAVRGAPTKLPEKMPSFIASPQLHGSRRLCEFGGVYK